MDGGPRESSVRGRGSRPTSRSFGEFRAVHDKVPYRIPHLPQPPGSLALGRGALGHLLPVFTSLSPPSFLQRSRPCSAEARVALLLPGNARPQCRHPGRRGGLYAGRGASSTSRCALLPRLFQFAALDDFHPAIARREAARRAMSNSGGGDGCRWGWLTPRARRLAVH